MRALLLLALFASAAQAQPEPRTTYVDGTLRGTTAVFRARYVVTLEGPTYARGAATLWTPEDASVTRVVVEGPGGRHVLGLVAAEQGAKRFDAIGDTLGAKRWAVLLEARGSSVDVSFASPEAATLVLELELVVPTCFDRDVRYARVPAAWKPALAPALRTTTKVVCHRDEDALWVAFPAPALANRPAGAGRIGTNAGRVRLDDMHVTRLEVAIAGALSEVPRDLATAILVDSSRSMTRGQFEAQRELVMAYARAAGETQVQLVAYARTARAVLPSWSNARAARSGIDRALRSLAARNGSNIDTAFDEAARWLAPHAGTKRVVLFTDARAGRRVTAQLDMLAKRLPPGTLVHVVTLDEASPLQRDAEFGKILAEGTGGIAVRARGHDDEQPLDATELVRPVRIDDLSISAPGWRQFGQGSTSCTTTLDEGGSCTWWGEGSAPAGPLAISGKLWSKAFARIVTPDGSRATELARALVQMTVLDDRSLARAQQLARAANAATSFYGEWGRAGGYSFGSLSLHGSAHCCTHARVTDTIQGRIATVAPVRTDFDLSPQFAHVVSRCGLGEAHVEATLELTEDEIVDVVVIAPPAVARCVEDEIWDTAITTPSRARFHIADRIVLVH